MKDFMTYLNNIDDPDKREKLESIFNYIKTEFPQLKDEIRWNQPMFTDHGTFIIAFSTAKNHISVAPEAEVLELFKEDIEKAGYSYTKQLFRIKWTDKVDYELLRKIIAYNIESKKDYNRFWR